MPRSIQIYFPPNDFEWNRQVLEALADSIISDDEAGQRGAKLSKLFQMLAAAYIGDIRATEEAMRQVKRIAKGEHRPD
jgi:hypothetical protein